jgi:carboxypeptidase C (cathepsin A)
MLRRIVPLVVLLVAIVAPAHAQRGGGSPQSPTPAQAPSPSPPATPARSETQPGEPQAPQAEPGGPGGARLEVAATEDRVSQTSHVIRLDGREIRYTATAGTLPIRLDDGRVAARMFFVGYTKDGEDVKTRPIAFLYNGGPGSASVWLHMGAFSPRRVEMGDEGFQPPPPYRLVDNANSLIDIADLVFVDAIDTGYSRVTAGTNAAQFHGQTGDIRAFGEFINQYLKTYSRWPSPKFLIGESYGTIRSAGLAGELQSRHGIELNGIVLISSLLTFQTILPGPENDLPYEVLVPTYTATAWYHKKLAPDLQGDLRKAVAEARTFAMGDYTLALTKGSGLTNAERQTIAQQLARLIGLSPQYVLAANLRVSADRYRKELLRDKRTTIGRYDSRFTGLDRDAAGEREEYDPSDAAIKGPFTALFQDYIKSDLKFESDLHYPTLGNYVRPWTYDQNRYMDMTETLRETMTRNPFLKVFVACGYYDMATPFAGSEFNFSHLAFDKAVTDRVSFGYYESGHMVYLRQSAHKTLKSDVSRFLRGASGPFRPPAGAAQP